MYIYTKHALSPWFHTLFLPVYRKPYTNLGIHGASKCKVYTPKNVDSLGGKIDSCLFSVGYACIVYT